MARTLAPEVKVLLEMTSIILDYKKVPDSPQDHRDLYAAAQQLKAACGVLHSLLKQADTLDQIKVLEARKAGKVVSIQISEKFNKNPQAPPM